MNETVSSQSTQGSLKAGKKQIGIEELLAWAYRQELPKVQRGASATWSSMASGWGGISRYGELMTLVDVSPNAYGCTPNIWGADEAEPHEDALRVAEAVAGLSASSFEWAEGYDVLSDITILTNAERADCNRRGFDIARAKGDQLAALVISRAMLGKALPWRDHGEVARRTITGARGDGPAWFRKVLRQSGDGRPDFEIEVDGRDPRTRRPYPGAYQKSFLSPDPSLLAADRLDYQAWVSALRHLGEALAGLTEHVVMATTRLDWPWEGEALQLRRPVIHSLAGLAQQPSMQPA